MFISLTIRPSRIMLYGGLFLLVLLLAIGLSRLLQYSLPQVEASPQAGGNTTLYNRSSRSFTLPAPGLTAKEAQLHAEGDAAFDATFVTAPAPINPGLGPRFNNTSCVGCHINNGRGMPEMGQALIRASLPTNTGQSIDPQQGVVPIPNIGTQIRDRATQGEAPDAQVSLTWTEIHDHYPDGTPYHLRQPTVKLAPAAANQPLPTALQTSLRIPPPVFGVGLLEAVPEAQLAALADPDDRNRDGISGRINHVWNPLSKSTAIGRFGLKANTPNLLVQTASAYVHDMGVTNPVFPEGDHKPEIDQTTLDQATFYVQSLGVPARTQLDDPVVRQGEQLFVNANCAACHVATLKTGKSHVSVLTHQTIHPYTDLLLHDMGPGLADGRPDFEANGQEWRTAPLWGLGLTQTVLPYAGYLHDGRARTIAEAILWHGGEAQRSRQQFIAMQPDDRNALLKFLNSL